MAANFEVVIFYNVNDPRIFISWKRHVSESLLYRVEEREKIIRLLRGGPILGFLKEHPEATRALVSVPPYINTQMKRKYGYTFPVTGVDFSGMYKKNSQIILDILTGCYYEKKTC